MSKLVIERTYTMNKFGGTDWKDKIIKKEGLTDEFKKRLYDDHQIEIE